jgi:hypothetical protein
LPSALCVSRELGQLHRAAPASSSVGCSVKLPELSAVGTCFSM